MKLDLSEVYWLHDDWQLIFKCGDFIEVYYTEGEPEWFLHDPSECEPDCLKCSNIWTALCDKYAGDALVAFGLGTAEPYVPEDFDGAVWHSVWPYLKRLRDARMARLKEAMKK